MDGLANLDCCPGFGSRLRAPGARPSPISSHRIAPPPASQPAGQLAHHHQATLDASRQVRGARYYLRRFDPQSVVAVVVVTFVALPRRPLSLSLSLCFAHTYYVHTYTYNTLVILRRPPPSVAQQPPLSFTHTCATTTTTISPNNTFVPPNKTTAQSPARRS